MNNHELNREGRQKVEDELLKRGAAMVPTTSPGRRKTNLLETDSNHSRTVGLRIKTRRKGSWHATTDDAMPAATPPRPEDIESYWVFVHFSDALRYWVVPDEGADREPPYYLASHVFNPSTRSHVRPRPAATHPVLVRRVPPVENHLIMI